MAEVKLSALKKSYGETEVLHGVDCAIEDGEFLVIVGPSGCGKSTLLRMVAGLESVTAGEISIGQRVVNSLEPADRDIAMVFQNYALYPHMSVYANMAYGLKIRGMAKSEIEERVKKAASILELTDEMLQRRPRQLSGGQRQRVAMGRAIVREPSVFLFDEPLSNLDAKLRVQMRLEIKRLQANLGITSIYVTHDQIEAMTLGHRLLVLNDGYLEQLGRPLELYERPASRFVAGFIGSPAMNLLEGILDSSGQRFTLSDGTALDLPISAPGGLANTPVTLGIRPEHLKVSESGGTLASFHVEVVEQLGADSILHGHFGHDRNEITIRVEGIARLGEGDNLALSVQGEHLHFFDSEDGKRL